ncbi:MAG: EF-P beta-lysylation protein EpmB [Marinicella sp.]
MDKTWQQNLKAALKGSTLEKLKKSPGFSSKASQLFAPVITETIDDLIDWLNPKDPILQQFLPQSLELEQDESSHTDPVGDHQSEAVPGLIHKYHGRVLLIASGSCAVNCRYCFRRHFPYEKSYAPRNQWHTVINYIKSQPNIHEVILSGGDPLTLSNQSLQTLTEQLATMDHVKTLRIHSRIPVVLPSRIDAGFIDWSQALTLSKVMVLHINHSQELSPEAILTIYRLKQAGYTLLNQSVLLKGVNDSAEVLAELSHQLFNNGVLPYYLHQFDRVQNAGHFAIELNEGNLIYQQLQKLLPGYLLPKWVVEQAGQPSKTLLTPTKTTESRR